MLNGTPRLPWEKPGPCELSDPFNRKITKPGKGKKLSWDTECHGSWGTRETKSREAGEIGRWGAWDLGRWEAQELGVRGPGEMGNWRAGKLGSWGAGSFGKACALQLPGPELDPQKSCKDISHGAVHELPVLGLQRQEDL